jgi:hypothetical protein
VIRGCLALAIVASLLLAPLARADSKNALAVGVGQEVGLVGIKYERVLNDGGDFVAGLGAGLTFGIIPKFQWNFVEFGNWNLDLGVGAMYVPVDSVAFSPNSLTGFVGLGFQRWAYRTNGAGVYLSGGGEFGYQFHGTREGDPSDQPLLSVKAALGLSF